MIGRSLSLLLAGAMLGNPTALFAQAKPADRSSPATPASAPTISDPSQKTAAPTPSSGDVHESPPPLQTSAPATPGTTTPAPDKKTDSSPPLTDKPK